MPVTSLWREVKDILLLNPDSIPIASRVYSLNLTFIDQAQHVEYAVLGTDLCVFSMKVPEHPTCHQT